MPVTGVHRIIVAVARRLPAKPATIRKTTGGRHTKCVPVTRPRSAV